MILDNLRGMERPAFVELRSGPFDQKAGPEPPGRRRGGKGSAVLGPAF
jgi:hypothetical protein